MKMQRYRKLDLLGSGGMGEVWLVHDEQLGCYWAMKLLKEDSDADHRKAFEKETAVLTSLQHPAIPRIVDRIDEDGQSAVIMDLVEGIALSDCKEMSTEAQLIDWAKQLLDILKHIHERQILYLDLKPDNIMLDPAGRLHLIDFGIACFKNEQNPSQQRFGTIGYSPQEQYEASELDERCDIYAFGKTMLALATGASADQLQTMQAADTSLSQGFRLLIDGCIRQNRSERYDCADQILKDLERIHSLHSEIHMRKKRRKRIRCCLFGFGTLCYIGVGSCLFADHQLKCIRYEAAMRASDYPTAIMQRPNKVEPYRRLYEETYKEQLQLAQKDATFTDAIAQARSYSVKRMQEYRLDVTICDDEFLALIVQDVLLSGDESLLSYAAHACEAFQERSKYEVLSQLIHAMSEQQPFTQSEQIIAKWLTQKQSQKNYMEWGILFAQLYELHVLELDETAFQHWRTLMTRLEEIRSLQDIDWLNEDMTRLLYVMQADCYYQYGRYLKTNSSSEFQKSFESLFAVNEQMRLSGYRDVQVLSQCGNACLYLFTEGEDTMRFHLLEQSKQYFEAALSINRNDTAATKGLADCERLMKYWGRL